MDTHTFLQRSLGDEGYYCLLGIKDKKKLVTRFFSDVEDLVNKANELDSQGYDCFFGLSTFTESTRRTGDNAKKLKSFFLDLDVDIEDPKKFNSQHEALSALQRFCRKLSLPKPLIVNSGNGVHVHWQLKEAVLKEDWKIAATRFKKIIKEQGLLTDPAVTSDTARVLRVPHTHNHKNEPKQVTFFGIPSLELHDFDQFVSLLGVDTTPVPTPIPEGANAVMANLMGNRESYFKDILKKSLQGDGCAQLKHIVENPNDISEPLWFNGISIIKHCVDGGRKGAHKISCGHENYDPEETDSKYDTVEYVHTCERFDENNEGVCDNCKHWGKIKSPIVLGNRIKESDPHVESNFPIYPKPYFRGANGGVYRRENKDGDIEEVLVYHNDLYVVERIRDDMEGECIVMELRLPKEKPQKFTISLRTVASQQKFKEALAEKGVSVLWIGELMKYTNTWINELQATTRAKKARNQFGWVSDNGMEFQSFILGDKEIRTDEILENPPSVHTGQYFHLFSSKGSLEEWKEITDYYNKDGFELHQYIIGTGFGSPLMIFMPEKGAGLNVHGKSGVGKSTAMYAAAGIWANPAKYCLKYDDTQASIWGRAEAYKNLPLYIDELTGKDPKALSNFAYSISGGQQRNRQSKDANTERWRGDPCNFIMVSSANESLIQKISSEKDNPAAEGQRLAEYKAEELLGNLNDSEGARELAMKIQDVYGVAGVPYIQHVLRNLSQYRTETRELQKKLDKAAGLLPVNRFWSAKAACSLMGLLISKKLGLHNFDMVKQKEFVIELLKSNKESLEEMESNVEQQISDYLSQYWGNILKVHSTEDGRKKGEESLNNNGLDQYIKIPEKDPRTWIVGRYEPDTKYLYLRKKPLKEWCIKYQIDFLSMERDLLNHPTLAGEKVSASLTKGVSLRTSVTRLIRINMDCSTMVDA